MFKHVVITIKKTGTANRLNFCLLDKIRFFFGLPVQYQGHKIYGHFGAREIYSNLENGATIPKIRQDITENVRYEFSGFVGRYPNGQGYYGKTAVDSRTLDGEQSLSINGPTTNDVREALDRFIKGELPSVWEPQLAQKSLPVVRVQGAVACYHHDDDADIFFSR